MNMKTLSLAAGVGSLLFAGVASADYTGLSGELHANGGVSGTWTARIYANFSDAGDMLNAVYGDSGNTLSVGTDTSFYQNTFGGPTSTSINPALYDAFPSLVYDSWVTIGLEDQTGNALLDIGIDFSDFEAGGGISTNNGSWFATPDDPQVLAGSEMRVLIGQFTVYGSGHVSGVLNMQGKTAGGDNWVATGVAFDYAIPAPGALALLGLAGLAGTRRRRA